MKDNNEQNNLTVEMPMLKSELMEKLYGDRNKSESINKPDLNNIEILEEPKPIIENNTNIENNDNVEKTKVFNYKEFEENKKQEEENIELEKEHLKDEEQIIKTKEKNLKKTIFKFVVPISIISIIIVGISLTSSYAYSDKLKKYEEDTTVYDKNIDASVKVYEGHDLSENAKNNAAKELVDCYNSKIDTNNMPENIQNVIDKINKYYNESGSHFAFAYKDIYTGFTVTYNESQPVFTASTIKAPTDLYIYEMASLGKVDLDEEMTYTSNYYNPKSGKLKFNPFNTKYPVRELLRLSTVYSDNAAHNMLEDKFGRTNMLEFWKEKGSEYIFTQNTNWGVLNAHDGLVYMQELYDFYQSNETYGNEIMENFKNASPKFIKGKNDYQVANKSGWGSTSIHDVSIIFAENPYIVVGLSTLGLTEIYNSYFEKVNDLAYELHTEYWKYKTESCNNIKQY